MMRVRTATVNDPDGIWPPSWFGSITAKQPPRTVPVVQCRTCNVAVLADGDADLIHDPAVPHPDDGVSHLCAWLATVRADAEG